MQNFSGLNKDVADKDNSNIVLSRNFVFIVVLNNQEIQQNTLAS